MPVVALNSRVLVTFVGTLCQQRIMSTFLYKVTSAAVETAQDVVFTAFDAELGKAGNLRPAYLAACPSNYTLNEIWYQQVAPIRFRRYTTLHGRPGLFSAVGQAANMSASVTRCGELSGRKYVGGVRIPIGTTADAVANGLLTAPQLAALQQVVNTIKLNVLPAAPAYTFQPQAGVNANPMDSVPVWDAFYQLTSRVMRRRTVGLGI